MPVDPAAPDPQDRPLAHLVGYCLEISTRCGCSTVRCWPVDYMVGWLGPSVTLNRAKARLICKTCGQRPELLLGLQWGVSGGRDRRPNPAPLPDWVSPLLDLDGDVSETPAP